MRFSAKKSFFIICKSIICHFHITTIISVIITLIQRRKLFFYAWDLFLFAHFDLKLRKLKILYLIFENLKVILFFIC